MARLIAAAGSTCCSPATASPPTTSSPTCWARRSASRSSEGAGTEGGHSNHLRVINEVRRHGSIAAAVDAGYVTGGVMYECVHAGVPFVLGGSIRDDGPLPDTMTDVVAAADAHARARRRRRRRAHAGDDAARHRHRQHACPAGVETFCVDINQAVVTKLADRGSHQAHGIVTDVGPFLRQLADALAASDGRRAGWRSSGPALSWGRRYLMCPPTTSACSTRSTRGCTRRCSSTTSGPSSSGRTSSPTCARRAPRSSVMDPDPSVPDMVFTANAGIVNGDQFVPSHFRYPERQAETEIFAAWFAEQGFRVDRLPAALGHEGAGDALPFGGVLLRATGSDRTCRRPPSCPRLDRCPVRPIELVDERLYHIDITFCPLDDRHALVRARWAGTATAAR